MASNQPYEATSVGREYPNSFEALIQERNSRIPLIERISRNVDQVRSMEGKSLFNANAGEKGVASDPVYQKLDEAYSLLAEFKRGNFEFINGGELIDRCHADLNILYDQKAIKERTMDKETYGALSQMTPLEIMMDAGGYVSQEVSNELRMQSTAMKLAMLGDMGVEGYEHFATRSN